MKFSSLIVLLMASASNAEFAQSDFKADFAAGFKAKADLVESKVNANLLRSGLQLVPRKMQQAEHCPNGFQGESCYSLFARHIEEVGFICYGAYNFTDRVIVHFETIGEWNLLSAHLWIGEDEDAMPTVGDYGKADVNNFPGVVNFSDEPCAYQSFTFEVPLSDIQREDADCESDVHHLHLVAHAKVTQCNKNGRKIKQDISWADGDKKLDDGQTSNHLCLKCPHDDDKEELVEIIPEDPGGFGDPHFKTWKGHRFEFHGECDLVLGSSPSFANGLGLDIHVRTTMKDDWSFISEAAVRIGDDVFEMAQQGMYYLNGKPNPPMPAKISGFKIRHSQSDTKRNYFAIELGNHMGRIELQEFKDFAYVRIVNGKEEHFADAIGMMGNWEQGAMVARDGQTIIEDPNTFGLEWQVRDSEPKLFQDIQRMPQYPAKCIMPNAQVATERNRRLSQSDVDLQAAEKACSHLPSSGAREACVYDVMATGDLEMADAGAF